MIFFYIIRNRASADQTKILLCKYKVYCPAVLNKPSWKIWDEMKIMYEDVKRTEFQRQD